MNRKNTAMQINTKNIKAIIFDLGNVLIPIDWNISKQCFEKYGAKITPEIENELTLIATASEKGIITENEFREQFCNVLKIKMSDQEFDNCWNKIIIDYPQESKNLVSTLTKNFDIYILSNLNSIHYRYIQTLPNWDESPFKKLFLSYRMLSVKPEREIFEKVLREINLNPSEIIYFDDRQDHIATAQSLGINGIQVKNRETTKLVETIFSSTKINL